MNGKGIQLEGIITDIFPSEIIGQFEKRPFWVKEKTDSKYPQIWAIEFHQGDCNTLDKFKPGDDVIVTVDIRGKGWEKNGKRNVFNTLKATGMVKAGESKPEPSNRQKTGKADDTSRIQQDTTAYDDLKEMKW